MFLSRSILTNSTCSQNKKQNILETGSLQLVHDALGDL